MNLENWQRREFIGATYSNGIVNRYYGYTNVPNAADTDEVFSISKVTVSGTVETVTWNDNSFASNTAKWSERVANFAAPSGSLGFTYSGTNPLFFTWTRLAGVNQYNIVVKNSSGYVATEKGHVNTNSSQAYTEKYFNTTSHTQRFYTGTGTYTIVLQAVNAGGTLTATYSYTS